MANVSDRGALLPCPPSRPVDVCIDRARRRLASRATSILRRDLRRHPIFGHNFTTSADATATRASMGRRRRRRLAVATAIGGEWLRPPTIGVTIGGLGANAAAATLDGGRFRLA